MRILTATPSFLPRVGGLELCLHNVSLAHRRAGHAVAVAAPLDALRSARAVPYLVLPVFRNTFARSVGGPGLTTPEARRRLLRARLRTLHRLYRPDVWHLEDVYPSGWSMLDVLQDELGARVVVSAHGGDIHTDAATGFGELLDERADQRVRSVLARADRLIAINQRIAETYLRLGAPEKNVFVIEQGKAPEQLADARARADQDSSSPHELSFLTVAADRPEKRLDLVVDTAERLPSDAAWSWTVLTTDDRIARVAEERGLAHRLSVVVQDELSPQDLTSPLPQLATFRHFANASILVHTSRTEGASNVFREAWASGCPVIASTGAGADDVDQGVDGLLFDNDDPDGPANILRQLLQSPDEVGKLCDGARSRSGSIRPWSEVAAERRELYASLL